MSQFPTSIPTLSTLYVANALAETTLNGAIDASTLTITVSDASRFTVPCTITIDSETIDIQSKVGNVLTAGSRGLVSTTAALHSNGAKVQNRVSAAYHNAVTDELMSVAKHTTRTRLVTINRTALTAASTTQVIDTGLTITQYEKVIGVSIKHSAAFTGGSVVAAFVTVGTSGDASALSGEYSLSAVASDTTFEDYTQYKSVSMGTAATSILATFTSVGANLSTLTSTSTVTIWVTTKFVQ